MTKVRIFFVFSVFLAAASAIAYEILAAGILTVLLGSSILYFSLTIGIFLAALGIGGWFSAKIIKQKLSSSLIIIESITALLGGWLAAFFYWVYGPLMNVFKGLSDLNYKIFFTASDIGTTVFYIFVFGFLFLVGVLVGFELPLFSRLLAMDEELRKALGRVFFWDYAGALAASVFLPLVILPYLGLFSAALFFGCLNILAAAIIFLVYIKEFKKRQTRLIYLIIIFVIFVINIVGLINAPSLERKLADKIYSPDKIIYYQHSPYQQIVFTQSDKDEIKLYLNGQKQFNSGVFESAYHESLVHPAFLIASQSKRILILGGGDGLALREVLKYPKVESVVLVDIDKEVIRAAKELDFMKQLNNGSFFDPRVKVIIDDAFKFIEKDKCVYDVVIVDFPDATDDGLARLYSKEFYLNLRQRLNDEGIAAIQSSAYFNFYNRLISKTLEASGFFTLSYHPPRTQEVLFTNGFVLASKKPISQDLFANKNIVIDTDVLTPENFSDIFTPISPIFLSQSNYEGQINSIFHPVYIRNPSNSLQQRFLQKE